MNGLSDNNRKIMRRQKALLWIWPVTALMIVSGCSIAKPPTDALTNAELSLREASEARADELAPGDIKVAKEKLEKSKQAMAAEKYDEARRLAESAQVDAELAQAKAESEITRQAADEIRKRIDAIQTDAERESRKPLSPGNDKE